MAALVAPCLMGDNLACSSIDSLQTVSPIKENCIENICFIQY
jgi:hypothetical protein